MLFPLWLSPATARLSLWTSSITFAYLKGVIQVLVQVIDQVTVCLHRQLLRHLVVIWTEGFPVLDPDLVRTTGVPQQPHPGHPHRDQGYLGVAAGTPTRKLITEIPAPPQEDQSNMDCASSRWLGT